MSFWRYAVIAVVMGCTSYLWATDSVGWRVWGIGICVLLCVDAICDAIKESGPVDEEEA